jgi:hypothetical protein
MLSSDVFGALTLLALALALVFAGFAAVYVARLGARATTPRSEEIGSAKTVLAKVRKRQPMSQDELDYAKQLAANRSSLMTLCIPDTLFSAGRVEQPTRGVTTPPVLPIARMRPACSSYLARMINSRL